MIAVELIKMLRRPRTWLIIGMLIALPTLVAVLLAITDLGPRPGTGPPFLSAVLSDGTLFPLAALGVVLPLLLPIAVAVLGGDAIAGESQTGHAPLPSGSARRAYPTAARQAGYRCRIRAACGPRRRSGFLRRRPPAAGPGSGHRHSEPEWLDAHPAGADLADRASPRVHDHLHAGRRSGRVVLLDPDEVLDRRGTWNGRHADRLDCVAWDQMPRTRCIRSCRPAIGWRLSTCSATRSCGEMSPAVSSSSSAISPCSRSLPGQTSAPKTLMIEDQQATAVGACGISTPSTEPRAARTTGLPGSWP